MVSIPVIPYQVAVGAAVDIDTVTAVNPNIGGIAGRQKVRDARRQFTCIVGPDYAPVVRKIHYTHRCRWPVAIRDWGDYIFEDQELLYTADGGDFLAPLRRLIQPAPGTRYLWQRVLIPDENEVDVVLKIGGTPISRGAWTFDNFGVPRIDAGLLAGDPTLTWSGRALVPACFMDGVLSIQINTKQVGASEYGIQSIPQLRLEEIFEEELIQLMDQTDDSQ